METNPTIHLTIPPEDEGRLLLDLVAVALDGDRDGAAWLIDRGGLWANGARTRDGAAHARAGDTLAIRRPSSGNYPEVALAANQILYEDGDLIVIDKPAGAYVIATPWDIEGNLLAALERFLTKRDGAAPVLHLAHRLDRDTSGVLLCSKNPAVNPKLQIAFGKGRAHKAYLALCSGAPAADEFEVETGHGRSAYGRFRAYPAEEIGQVLLNGSRVKAMRTRFQVERRLGDATLLYAFPQTGRTHQIRLHLAHLGHPLLGDATYGGPATWRGEPITRHLLHAERLELPHPRTGQLLVLISPAPAWADH